MRKKEKTCESLENASKSLNIYLKTPVLFNRETGVFNTVINNFFNVFPPLMVYHANKAAYHSAHLDKLHTH